MKKIYGMIVAIETSALEKVYPDIKKTGDFPFEEYAVCREKFDLRIVKTGMGEIAAATGVQYLATKYGVGAILNFGVVGGLTDGMKAMKVCLVKNVVHYKYDCSEFMPLKVGQVDGHDSIYLPTSEELLKKAEEISGGLPTVTCCSGDKFVGTAEEKTYLHNTFGGDICDMESAGIVLACETNKIPCLLMKAVSDGLSDGAGGFYAELSKASDFCLSVADKIINGL